MAANVEIKARACNFLHQQKVAASLATAPAEVLDQIDTFFQVPCGRLKLRQSQSNVGELIFYEREDICGPKVSTYSVSLVERPDSLRMVLTSALGITAEICKRRTVYHVGQTRIHLDQVKGLGGFVELEVVLRPEQSREEGALIVKQLMQVLNIAEADLIEKAYVDLLPPR